MCRGTLAARVQNLLLYMPSQLHVHSNNSGLHLSATPRQNMLRTMQERNCRIIDARRHGEHGMSKMYVHARWMHVLSAVATLTVGEREREKEHARPNNVPASKCGRTQTPCWICAGD